MYTYTLAFVLYHDTVLMINRQKSPWKGMWNGLGGKIMPDETPLESIQRELHEEMGTLFPLSSILDRGFLTWNDFDASGQGIHLFIVKKDSPFDSHYPIPTEEGILDVKSIEWILDSKNLGVAPNIKYFLKPILESPHHIHCTFKEGELDLVEVIKL